MTSRQQHECGCARPAQAARTAHAHVDATQTSILRLLPRRRNKSRTGGVLGAVPSAAVQGRHSKFLNNVSYIRRGRLHVFAKGGACANSAVAQWHKCQSEPASKFTAHRAVVPAIAYVAYRYFHCSAVQSSRAVAEKTKTARCRCIEIYSGIARFSLRQHDFLVTA